MPTGIERWFAVNENTFQHSRWRSKRSLHWKQEPLKACASNLIPTIVKIRAKPLTTGPGSLLWTMFQILPLLCLLGTFDFLGTTAQLWLSCFLLRDVTGLNLISTTKYAWHARVLLTLGMLRKDQLNVGVQGQSGKPKKVTASILNSSGEVQNRKYK